MKNPIFFLIILFISLSFSAQKIMQIRPNIVFIMSDDHAVSAVSAYKRWLSEIAPTPNIDGIAEKGMLMTRTFNTNSFVDQVNININWKYSHVNGFFKNEKGGDFDGSQMTFPKLFQKSGYQTAVIGKWHLGTTPTGLIIPR